MAKLADIRVVARNEHNSRITHEAKYPCSVDSAGIFRAEIEPEMFDIFKGICRQRRDLACKTEMIAARGGGARHVISGATLRNVELILWEHGKAMCDADVRQEVRIFYSLRLDASYYKTASGEILPNGQGVDDYGKDGGGWRGAPSSSMRREDGGHLVGVGASIARVTTVTPKSGATATSYDRVEDADPVLGEWARTLRRWTRQPWPSAIRGEPSKMLSIPYTEPAAKLFCDVLHGLSQIADMIETNLADADALPALIASGGLRLLAGPRA